MRSLNDLEKIRLLLALLAISLIGFASALSLLIYINSLSLAEYAEFMASLDGQSIKIAPALAKERNILLLEATETGGLDTNDIYSSFGGRGFSVRYDNSKYGNVILLPLAPEDSNTSMVPTFGDGYVIAYYAPKSEKDIRLGDIIIFIQDGPAVFHRVVAIGYDSNGWYALTKGDNNTVTDEKVRFDKINGRFNRILGIVLAVIY